MPLSVLGRPSNPWVQAILDALKASPSPGRRILVLANPTAQILGSTIGWLLRFKVIWLGDIQPPRSWQKPWLKLASFFAHSLITPNQGSEIIYLRAGIPNTKIRVVYPPSRLKEPAAKKIETITLGCEAVVDIDEGLGTLLRAVVLSRDILGKIKLILGCTGQARAKIEWSAKQLGLNGQVQMADSRRPAWLEPAHIYILPATSDRPAPLSLWQALALSKAVIATDKLGHKEFVEDGKNGLVVAPNDAEVLSQAIIKLARDENLRLQFGRYNYEFTQARCGETVFKQQIEKILA